MVNDANVTMDEQSEELDVEAQFELLVQLIDEQFEQAEFVELIRTGALAKFAELAASFGDDDSSNVPLVLLSLIYVFTHRLQDVEGVLGHGGKFSLLRPGIADDLGAITANEAAEVLEAMVRYVRVAPEGDIVLEDDEGQQFVVVSLGHQILPCQEVTPLDSIPIDTAAGKELLFHAVRGIVKLEYEQGLLMGLLVEF